MTTLSLAAIDEGIAKAKADLAFLEKAREVLADPRIASILGPVPNAPARTSAASGSPAPRVYGALKEMVYSALPEPDSSISATIHQIVGNLQGRGYEFIAKDPGIAVNGALVSLEQDGRAKCTGKNGNARLWRKKKSQEAPEGAS